VIYLLGGSQRTKKTTVAETLVRREAIPFVGTDAFAFVLEHAAPQVGIGLSMPASERRVAFFPFLRALIHCQTLTTPRYLIEGEAIAPEDVPLLAEEFPVVACFVGYDSLSVDELLVKRPSWVESLHDDAREALVAQTIERSHELQEECRAIGLPYVDVSGPHDDAVDRVIDVLLSLKPPSHPRIGSYRRTL
jgi:hypothetical protein